MLRKLLAAAIVAGAALAGASSAHAAFLFNGWSMDLQGIDALPDPGASFNLTDIHEFNFDAVAHVVTDPGADLTVNTGDISNIEGIGILTGYNDSNGVVGPFGLNAGEGDPIAYEITFTFTAQTRFTDDLGNFTHNPVGTLNFYVDRYDGTTTKCSVADGTDCANAPAQSVLIGSFDFLAGNGGNLNLSTLDGSDDANLQATFLLAGVWFDDEGNPLDCNDAIAGQECDGPTLGFTNGNFDADGDENGAFDTQVGGFDCGGGGPQSLIDFCIDEEGGFRIGSIPEPGTLAVFSLGLVALGGLAGLRRRKS